MLKLKEKILGLLLFALGIAWGNFLLSEILSCPEWRFIGFGALMIGTGLYLHRFIPVSWQCAAPGLLLALIQFLPPSELRTLLMLPVFGIWYGSNPLLMRQWQISRIFCGGLLFGGTLAGIYTIPENVFILILLTLIHGGLNYTAKSAKEMILLAAVLLAIYPFPPSESRDVFMIDTGTVICGFSLVPEKTGDDEFPKIIFFGGRSEDHLNTFKVLNEAADIHFLPLLPGVVPACSSLIVVSEIPRSGSNGISALIHALDKDGVLIMPVSYCHLAPQYSWHILPGSDGEFAAMSPGRKLDTDPEKMDAQFIRHFKDPMLNAPKAGALTGLLVDFEGREINVPAVQENMIFYHLFYGLAALIILSGIWFFHVRRPEPENFRIILNCAGFTLLFALMLPRALSGLPPVSLVTSLMISITMIWIFRRPYKRKNTALAAGMMALAALLASFFFGGTIFAAAALLFGGYHFSALDGELCGERDTGTEQIRFLGIAAGAFAAYMMQKYLPGIAFFITVAAMRCWSWFRN
ncbi:MAG: hypothetical protein E7057_03440 [Lentisphaerae bacterium]|nr:hypothetical protein [Lentisphaerota bacterium]